MPAKSMVCDAFGQRVLEVSVVKEKDMITVDAKGADIEKAWSLLLVGVSHAKVENAVCTLEKHGIRVVPQMRGGDREQFKIDISPYESGMRT